MSLIIVGLALVSFLWAGSQVLFLVRNYNAAKSMGLPLVVVPYDPDGFIFGVVSEPLKPLLRRILPASARRAFDLTLWGWEFHDKSAIHERLGPAFVIVTTSLNRFVTADPAMANAILARRRDFVHPDVTTSVMGLLGHNLVTSVDDSWARQRRIVAPALNERISSGVWAESKEQANELVDALLSSTTTATGDPSASTKESITGLRAIAINVLKRVAYGRPAPYVLPSESAAKPAPHADMTYVDAISLCTELLLFAAFVPGAILRLPIMPYSMRRLGIALERLPKLTNDLLDNERRGSGTTLTKKDVNLGSAATPAAPDTIIRTLVRLSDEAKEQENNCDQGNQTKEPDSGTVGSGKSQYLSEDEIAGNLFIFTAAGFDTTANTLGFAVTLLAAHPQWQAWVQAEIDAVLYAGGGGTGKELQLPDYAEAFPRLPRCLALMFEVLRLFPAVTMLMRSTSTPQTIPCSRAYSTSSSDNDDDNAELSTITIPAPCAVYINTMALHASSSAWDDASEFNPARWIQRISTGSNDDDDGSDNDGSRVKAVNEEVIVDHSAVLGIPRGGFLPWSSGPRKCPGQKMSQVEFVAVIATLFGRCNTEPEITGGDALGGGAEEDMEKRMQAARQRLLDLTQDSQPLFTLAMNNPRDVRLRWTPR
ncbi:cytochrome P450 [Microdochium trichocladiopsis]|uniref:Cytochrome P450 n=1 Tax=Microdochium trichocladiopsis TaxID=1682393 RepID=A0A9P8XU85_9PEZI|nr:cytochrome P450 [Microdochium trichocladiopsis]KAH7012545.1 cytochrome P450 [Microdochium trichocladiopsis]